MWNLFIDDERNLEDVTWAPWQIREKYRNGGWVVVRSFGEALVAFAQRGFPSFISFDHDLGDNEKTGYDVAKFLVDADIKFRDGDTYKFPSNFDYYVHSKNPIGKANIEGLLDGYFKALARVAEVPADVKRADELFTIADTDEGGNITVGK